MKTQIVSVLAFSSLLTIPLVTQQGTANRLTGSDETFVTKAAQGNMAEIQLGQLAEKNASSTAVKDFGKRMVTDHNKLESQLQKVATDEHATLPTALNAKDQATVDQLSKLTGPAFDRAYINDMVRDHRADIGEFSRESGHGSDEMVKQFAMNSLPTLREHLRLAETTQKEVK